MDSANPALLLVGREDAHYDLWSKGMEQSSATDLHSSGWNGPMPMLNFCDINLQEFDKFGNLIFQWGVCKHLSSYCS